MLADLALEFGVQSFVYSSALQPDPDDDSKVEYSRISKRAIEQHCKALTEKGLNWTCAYLLFPSCKPLG